MYNINKAVFIVVMGHQYFFKHNYTVPERAFQTKILDINNSSHFNTDIYQYVYTKKYIGFSAAEQIEMAYQQKMINYKRNFTLGVRYEPTVIVKNSLAINRPIIGSSGLSINKNVSIKSTLIAEIQGSYKLPDRRTIQSSMQSRIMSAIQNGEDSLYINETIQGHIWLGFAFKYQYNYLLKNQNRIGLRFGIGLSSINSLNITVMDTISLEGINLTNPTGITGQSFNPSSNQSESGQFKRSIYRTLDFEVNYFAKLSPVINVSFGLPLKYFINSSGKSNALTIGANVGFGFTLNPGKY